MARASCVAVLAAAILVLAAVSGVCDEVPSEPILVVETGMHAAPVKRLDADAAGKILATASLDKTVRVFDAATGTQMAVLRPPQGYFDAEGRLYAVAVSPDGERIAAAGLTGAEWDSQVSVYVFDRVSGEMKRRIGGLPEVVNHLVFSKDGGKLAACLADGGLRVYAGPEYEQVLTDDLAKGPSYGADFAPDGRLAVSSYDGSVRLFDADLKPAAKAQPKSGKRPSAVAFSPDGSRLAVGFADVPAVDVLAGDDATVLFSPAVPGPKNGNLAAVCWSVDGGALYAGGSLDKNGVSQIVKWAGSGQGSASLLAALGDTVTALRALPGGGVAFCTTAPSVGVADRDGAFVMGPKIADFRNGGGVLRVSPDGSRVAFGYAAKAAAPLQFSIDGRALTELAKPDPGLAGPVQSAKDLEITAWKNSSAPKLNGKPFEFDARDRAQSLAVAPDGGSFVLGCHYFLRCFDKTGRELWKTPAFGSTFAVTVAGYGKVCLAAFADGTIRWYRMIDGQPLLALFPAADKTAWALWSPSGFFDAGPGGEELIGWLVNRGRDKNADFFPVSRFRATNYRPNLIAKILQSLGEKEALAAIEAQTTQLVQRLDVKTQLPPVVTIVSPAENETAEAGEITVKFLVRPGEGEKVRLIRALVDGRPAAETRDPSPEVWGLGAQSGEEASSYAMTVPVPGRDTRLSIIAENSHGPSDPAIVNLRAPKPATPAAAMPAAAMPAAAMQTAVKAVPQPGASQTGQAVAKAAKPSPEDMPVLYLVAVGVSRYQDPRLTLGFASKDAKDFAALLERQKGLFYKDVKVKLLLDEGARKRDVESALEWLRKSATDKDIAVVFLAGHGFSDQNGYYYFVTTDAAVSSLESIKKTCLPFPELKKTVYSLRGKTIFFVDTCQSGDVMGDRIKKGRVDVNGLANELVSPENGAVVFTSATGSQYAIEAREWGNGAFTKALLEGIGGRADLLKTGYVTVDGLSYFTSQRVRELTAGEQTPTTAKPKTIADFSIAGVSR